MKQSFHASLWNVRTDTWKRCVNDAVWCSVVLWSGNGGSKKQNHIWTVLENFCSSFVVWRSLLKNLAAHFALDLEFKHDSHWTFTVLFYEQTLQKAFCSGPLLWICERKAKCGTPSIWHRVWLFSRWHLKKRITHWSLLQIALTFVIHVYEVCKL